MSFTEQYCDEIEAVTEKLTAISDWSEEYNTEHTDAGDSYAHMVNEGYWPDQFKRLLQYAETIQADFVSVDTLKLLEDYIERDDLVFDMVPGHILGSPSGYNIDTWTVGEIEEQIEWRKLADELKIEHDVMQKILVRLTHSGPHCLRYEGKTEHCYLYINTDATWSANVPHETIEEAVTAAIIRYCKATDRAKVSW